MQIHEQILQNPYLAKKITVIEGPDGSGKTYLTKKLMDRFKETELKLIPVRCPDNRGGATIRDVIMSEELANHPNALAPLFIADFIYAFNSIIRPNLDNPHVRFIFDRFIPSTCVYQKIPLEEMNRVIQVFDPEMTEAFSHAQYFYLTPVDFEEHRHRMSLKSGAELNHLDPTTDDAIGRNIQKYKDIIDDHLSHGVLGSFDFATICV